MPLFASPSQTSPGGAKKFLFTLAADADRYNLASALTAAGWNGTSVVDVVVTIPAGRKVWSSAKTTPAFFVPASIPAGSIIRIDNAGLICGKGDWSPAGDALNVERACTVNNTGTINGGGYNQNGGPGSGGGQNCQEWSDSGPDGGAVYCNYGPCSPNSGSPGYGYGYSSAGSAATTGAGGGNPCSQYCCPGSGGPGGVGGGPGSSGKAVVGNALISWIATGTRNGAIT
jgi:hypothetical protein